MEARSSAGEATAAALNSKKEVAVGGEEEEVAVLHHVRREVGQHSETNAPEHGNDAG